LNEKSEPARVDFSLVKKALWLIYGVQTYCICSKLRLKSVSTAKRADDDMIERNRLL